MKKLIILLLLLICSIEFITGQTKEEKNVDNIFKRCDFIAEGEVLEIKYIASQDSSTYHQISVFKIFTTFKGKEKIKDGDTVQLLSFSYTPNVEVCPDHSFRLKTGEIGTLFFKNYYPFTLVKDQSKFIKYDLINEESEYFIQYYDYHLGFIDSAEYAAKGLYNNFKKLADFYNFLKRRGLQIPLKCYTIEKNKEQLLLNSQTKLTEEQQNILDKKKQKDKEAWDAMIKRYNGSIKK